VLVVADDEVIRDLARQALRDEGYDAHGTAAGAEVSAMLDAAAWDVVVVDDGGREIDAEVLILEQGFTLDELVVRVEALLGARSEWTLRVGDLELDPLDGDVRRGTERLALTPTEFRLLRFLLQNPRRVLSKRQILDNVWNYDFGGDANVVETYVSYLRRKLDSTGPPLIHTVRLVGYVLREPDR